MPALSAKRIREFIEPFKVPPGKRVVLARDFDPTYKAAFVTKEEGEELLQKGVELLADYQARLAAQDTYALLVCLQALDAAGKDGTIRHVMSGVNPQGVEVHSFKVPSAEELDHDYLWRYQQRLPARGNIGIFNRSHYEEVLVVRVHEEILAGQKLPKAARRSGVWERRYRSINDWERHLVENGYEVVKLFLNLSNEEQRRRFLARIDERDKNWKFSAGDAPRAPLLGRLPEGVLRDALQHQHRVGALVRDPGRPEVVRAHRGRGRHRRPPVDHRPQVPRAHPRAARRPARGEEGASRRRRRPASRPTPSRRNWRPRWSGRARSAASRTRHAPGTTTPNGTTPAAARRNAARSASKGRSVERPERVDPCRPVGGRSRPGYG